MSRETKRGPGRPPLSDDVARLEVRLPAALLTQVEERAEREGVTLSEWVRAALLRALAQSR